MWGVVEVDDVIHVVPLGEDGLPSRQHEPTAECPCHPEIEEHVKTLVIHNQLQ